MMILSFSLSNGDIEWNNDFVELNRGRFCQLDVNYYVN